MIRLALILIPLLFSAVMAAAEPCPKQTSDDQCMKCAIYHEARGEKFEGQVAVAVVIENRVQSPAFPNTVCGVVWQQSQFSFTQDGKADSMANPKAIATAERAYETALAIIEDDTVEDTIGLTTNVMWFHTTGVLPRWSRKFNLVATIGYHKFYEDS